MKIIFNYPVDVPKVVPIFGRRKKPNMIFKNFKMCCAMCTPSVGCVADAF